MALDFAHASEQTKQDIVDIVSDCIDVAGNHNGYLYGDFVRNLLVPIYKENHSISDLFKTRDAVAREVTFNSLFFYFASDVHKDEFVQAMSEQLLFIEKDDVFFDYYLIKLGIKVAKVSLTTVFDPHYDNTRLAYYNNSWCGINNTENINKF